MTFPPSVDEVVSRVSREAFGRPLVTNVLRGQVVEAIIAIALEPEWVWCAADYSSWDFERADGLRLEVKQTAARQTWIAPIHGRIRPSFDIRARTGRWEDTRFIKETGRAAQLYVFAYHPGEGDEVDHRDPLQWRFFILEANDLPAAKTISLSTLRKLAEPVCFVDLKLTIQEMCRRIA